MTPATSVARCMTLGRCSTNGASGTFIEVQCGASASATERTAYSCSSRSFDDRASEAASCRSWASSPVRRIVPASTREVTSPRSRRTSISGVAPNMPVDVEGPAGRVAPRRAGAAATARRSARRPGRPGRGRARPSPGRRRRCGGPPRRPPAPTRRRRGRRRRSARRPGAPAPPSGVRRSADPIVETPMWVTQQVPSRRPTTTSGTISTLSPGLVGEGERAEGDQPGAGQPDLVADHGQPGLLAPPVVGVGEPVGAGGADRRRDAPADQALAAADPARSGRPSGSRASSGPGSSSATVRTTSARTSSGAAAGLVLTIGEPTAADPAGPPNERARHLELPGDPSRPGQEPRRRRRDVRRRGRALRPHQRRAVAGPGPALADRGRCGRSPRSRGSGSSTSPPAPAPRASRSPTPAPSSCRATSARACSRSASGPGPALPFVAGDGTRLPFADDTFDAVTISFGLRNIVDPDAGLREMLRVTRPGGRLVVCEFSSPTWAPFRTVYIEYLMKALPRGRPRGRRRTRRPTSTSPSRSGPGPTRPALAARIEAAGWRDCRVAQPLRRHRRPAPRHAPEHRCRRSRRGSVCVLAVTRPPRLWDG